MKLCENCDEEIPAARIALVPDTRLCVLCASVKEFSGQFQRHRMGFDVRTHGGELESMESYLVRG